jgi:aspartate 1-decarboxylase
MAKIRLMHAKLHRVKVTEANVNYVGSITIDRDLLDRVGLLPLEEVDIVNLNNGKRWSTYVIPGDVGSGQICPNGGAALLCQPGDLLMKNAIAPKYYATDTKREY